MSVQNGFLALLTQGRDRRREEQEKRRRGAQQGDEQGERAAAGIRVRVPVPAASLRGRAEYAAAPIGQAAP